MASNTLAVLSRLAEASLSPLEFHVTAVTQSEWLLIVSDSLPLATSNSRTMPSAAPTAPAVPDILAPGLRCVFCGINPGRRSSAAGHHFANPRNDFWRLLADSGLTPRRVDPSQQWSLLELGYGLTNAAYRTTKGSGELRRGDFEGSQGRLERIASDLHPEVLAFVGKAAYNGVFGGRSELGLQERKLSGAAVFVLPSTSPANAAVPWDERLRWFRALRELVDLG